jgi:hypothetical protein
MCPSREIQGAICHRNEFLLSWQTNAVADGTSSKIMAIKRKVGGYCSRENLKKTAIYSCCGGHHLYPR